MLELLEKHGLVVWRHVSPKADAAKDILDAYFELLERATAAAEGSLVAELIERVRDADRRAAFELGGLLHSRGTEPAALSLAWVGYAAFNGVSVAREVLAQHLLAEAAARERELADPAVCLADEAVMTRVWRAVEFAHGTRLDVMVLEGYEQLLARRGTVRDICVAARAEASQATEIFRTPEAAKGAARDPDAPASDRPTRQVVQEIGDSQSFEGRRIVRAYQQLTEPLVLKSSGLSPETIGDLLSRDFPWFAPAIELIVDDLRLQRISGRPWVTLAPIVLQGPPGCGKTAFCRTLAKLLDTGFGVLDVGGASDNRLLAGTARGWASAQPAYPLQLMLQTGCANPTVLIDELDKSISSANGDVGATLLGMLEPSSAGVWPDPCLMANANLGGVSWLISVNSLHRLSRPLLSRCRIVRIPKPDRRHAETILTGLERDLAGQMSVDQGISDILAPEVRQTLLAALRRGADIRAVRAGLRTAIARSGALRRPVH